MTTGDERGTAPKPFVFVLMPFAKAFGDIYAYGIKKVCTEAGAYCERVDEQAFDGAIVERIYHQIANADVIVSDMTGRNANVFYETGYAHALGKRTILLTQNKDDIPFDLQQYFHIIYSDISGLEAALRPRIEWALAQPEGSLTDPLAGLSFHIEGHEILQGAEVALPVRLLSAAVRGVRQVEVRFSIDIHNRQNRIIDAKDIAVGIGVPNTVVGDVEGPEVVKTSADSALLLFPPLGRLLPLGWRSLGCRMLIPFQDFSRIGKDIAAEIQIFSELGRRRTPFVARLHYQE